MGSIQIITRNTHVSYFNNEISVIVSPSVSLHCFVTDKEKQKMKHGSPKVLEASQKGRMEL